MVEEASVPGENYRPRESNWYTLSLAAASRVHPFCNLQGRARLKCWKRKKFEDTKGVIRGCKLTDSTVIDWCLTPTLAVFQLYRGVNKCLFFKLDTYKILV